MPSRRFFLKSLVGSAAALLGTGAYAFGIEPAFRLRVQRYALVPHGWPAGLNLRLAVLADLHAGEPHMPVSRVEEIVAAANGLGADVIVVLGDYLAGHRFMTRRVGMAEITPALAQLKAPLGVFSILGNHDWWDDQVAQRDREGPTVAARALREVAIP
ncbi:MAG TPA: metallophosphoesterase, partial [Beijerinckiaceae bacterium]|nr:metallophosphoesterase [Beijerinckiaceae bacterium]